MKVLFLLSRRINFSFPAGKLNNVTYLNSSSHRVFILLKPHLQRRIFGYKYHWLWIWFISFFLSASQHSQYL